MKFITLGSCVGGDCILQNKYRNWSSENYVSYSPIAILLGKNNDVDIPEEILTNEVPSQRKRLVNDFKGDVLDKIKKSTFDFLLVDLSDFRIDYKIIEFENGKRLIVTNRTINEETNNLINFYLKKN